MKILKSKLIVGGKCEVNDFNEEGGKLEKCEEQAKIIKEYED